MVFMGAEVEIVPIEMLTVHSYSTSTQYTPKAYLAPFGHSTYILSTNGRTNGYRARVNRR